MLLTSALLLVATSATVPSQKTVEGEWTLERAAHADDSFRGEGTRRRITGAVDPVFVDDAALVVPASGPLLTIDGAAPRKSLPSKAFSLEAWVVVDRAIEWGGFLCALQDNGAHERGWILGVRGERFLVGVATEETGGLTYLPSVAPHRPARWTHVVGTYDGRTLRLYVDGELDVESDAPSGDVLYDDTHELVVGAYKDSNEEYRVPGVLRSVAIDDRAWRPADVRKRYRRGKKDLPSLEALEPDAGSTAPELAKLRPAIDAAIDRGVEHLLEHQFRDGSWAPHQDGYRNGQTALNAYALFASGVGRRSAPITLALEYLASEDPTRTYSAGFQLAFLGALGDEQHAEWAQRVTDMLLEWESDSEPGSWGYPGGRPDISNAQIAALGLWGASRLGVETPNDLWKRAARGSIDRHQTVVEEVDWRGEDADRRTGKRTVAGFTYYSNGDTWGPSGSMATAGLCILGLAKDLAGKSLGGRLRRDIERSERLCFDWLEERWTVERNPGYVQDEGHLYYLYGLERIGAFYGIDEIGGYDWYREGAAYLVRTQGDDGDWGKQDETSFALLFLNRATARASSGPRARNAENVVRSPEGEVRVRCTGGMHQVFALDALDVERGEGAPPRVERVRWLVDGEVVAEVEGNAVGPWNGDPYPARWSAPRPGLFAVTCEVAVAIPGATVSGEPLRRTVTSKRVVLDLGWTPAAWLEAAARGAGTSLLAGVEADASASTERSGTSSAAAAFDGKETTAWLADREDSAPWIRIRPARPIKAAAVTLGHAGASYATRDSYSAATEVEVLVNGDVVLRERVEPREPGTIVLPLPEPTRVRELEVRVVGRAGGAKALGFSEIGLR